MCTKGGGSMACVLKGEGHGLCTKGGGGMACVLKREGAWPVY